MAVRTAMDHPIGALPRTPFPASRDFPSRGNEIYEEKNRGVICFMYYFSISPFGGYATTFPPRWEACHCKRGHYKAPRSHVLISCSTLSTGCSSPPVRRSRSQAEPWQPRAERPGGWLNLHARKGVSTFGNTGKHRPEPSPDPDRAERRLNPQAP